MKPRILVIDDEAAIRDSLKMILEYEDYEFIGAASGPDGIASVKRDSPDLVVLDIKMPGMNGLEALAEIRKVDEALPVAMISGHGTITDAMQATRLGAFDFIEKPFTSERVLVTVAKGLEVRELRQENRELKLAMESKYEIVGQSPALRGVLEAVQRAAPTNATVLLLGEGGVGKELVARSIHRNSLRNRERFVQVNCAAIPEELIESELFGHEKGSFTGATEKQIGKFEQADKGTIFLDEVGDMSPKTQAKVLRVLQEGEVERLGSARTIKVDVRVIAATNKNLEEEIEKGHFREDLYFRLSVIPITVPPLRERREDVPALVEQFLELARKRDPSASAISLTRETVSALAAHDWPGNVRELRNVLDRAIYIATAGGEREIRLVDLPVSPGSIAGNQASAANAGYPAFDSDKSYREIRADFESEFERRYVAWLLDRHSGNISAAAREAKMDRKHLYDLARKRGLRGDR